MPVSFGANPEAAPPSTEQVRQSVQQSLGFLEKEGPTVMQSKKCSSCHHVPMMLWSHNEARVRNFTTNQKAMDELATQAMAPYLADLTVQPTANVAAPYTPRKNFPGPEMLYIILGVGSARTLDDTTAQGLEKLLSAWIAGQEANGSWTLKNWEAPKKAPIYETDEVLTLWSLLALGAADKTKLDKEVWTRSRDRSLAWLKDAKPGDSTQALALRLLVRVKYGERISAPADEPLVKDLLARQNPDGGWSWSKAPKSDALGTGQALYRHGDHWIDAFVARVAFQGAPGA
jgi:squalene-hopene/tetraprenyl-beta-curcumene cyclase